MMIKNMPQNACMLPQFVKPAFDQFVAPSRRNADVIIPWQVGNNSIYQLFKPSCSSARKYQNSSLAAACTLFQYTS